PSSTVLPYTTLFRSYSILVVDDEAVLRDQLAAALTERGYQVDTASDGVEAAEKLAQKSYPLVLCDVRMPRMDGHQLLLHAREKEDRKSTRLNSSHVK